MDNSAYTIRDSLNLTSHFLLRTMLCRDRSTPQDPELDARVRSGDYFITLATELETIAEELPDASTAASSVLLSKIARDLDYIQRHYTIVRKHRPDEITELH